MSQMTTIDQERRAVSCARRLRISLGAFALSAVIFPQLYQPLLTKGYDYLKTTTVYRASTFETLWTVFCYAAIEPWLTVVFFRHPDWRLAVRDRHSKGQDVEQMPPTRPKGMRRPSRRFFEAVAYVLPLLLLDLTMIKKFGGVNLESMLISGNYDPSMAMPARYHGTNFLAPSLHNFTMASPLQTERALPFYAPSSRRIVLELLVSFVIYDVCFFLFHLALHVFPVLHRWHAPHHSHGEIHPQVTNQLSALERLGLVLLANFALNIIGSHVLTRTLFVPVFVWMLVEIHSGLDLPWGYEKILPQGWGGGAKKHASHHKTGIGNIEPFFNWCDGLLDFIIQSSRRQD